MTPATPMPAGIGLEDRLRATLLRAGSVDALLQDQIDSAQLAAACGFEREARALLALVFLRQGFSPAWRASRVVLAEQLGFWPSLAAPPADATSRPDFSVALAVEELRALMRRAVSGAALPLPARISLPDPRQRFREPDPRLRQNVLEAAPLLVTRLAALGPFPADDEIAVLLRTDAEQIVALPQIAVEEFIGEPTERLAAIFSLQQYRAFLADILPLLSLESDILPAIARLCPTALGPFFANVSLLIRDVRDLFALVEVAAEEMPGQALIERWALLLSLHLRRHQMLDLIDEFGDRGMIRALALLLQGFAQSNLRDPPKDMVWKIRDAFVDIGEIALGATAQELVALWSPSDPLEWELLSDLRSSGGDMPGARDALAFALQLEPKRASTMKRAASIDAGERVEVFGGYNSRSRRPLRLSRLAIFRAMA